MKALIDRWGEVIIRRCSENKRKFDCSKSFSILPTKNKLTIDELKELFITVTDLSEKLTFKEIKNLLKNT